VPSVAKTFGVDEFFTGKIIWLYMLPYGLAALIYGPLARSVENKKILLFCLSFFSLANIMAGLAYNIYVLFIARFLAGVCGAAIIPLSLILIAKFFPSQERGKKVGGFFSITFISSLLGLFLSGLIFWRWIFLLPAIGAVLVSVVIYFYFPSFSPQTNRLEFNYRQTLFDKQVLRLFIYIFFISFLYHGVRQWLGVYFSKAYNLEQFLISMLLTTIALSGILGESWGGILSDKLGKIRIINVGVGLMLVALSLLLFKNTLWVLFAIMFIWGVGWTFNHVGLSTNLCDLPHEHLYESASLNSSVRFLSGGIGASFGGIIAERSFNLLFVIFSFSLFLLIILSRKLLLKAEL
jgi:DHA1 family multidrug resistance protein-like MFS transporter